MTTLNAIEKGYQKAIEFQNKIKKVILSIEPGIHFLFDFIWLFVYFKIPQTIKYLKTPIVQGFSLFVCVCLCWLLFFFFEIIFVKIK